MLTEKQKLVCHEYLKHFNVAKALQTMGYAKTTATKNGWKFLKDPEVAMYLKQLIDEQKVESKVTAEAVLEELRRLSFSNIVDYYKYSAQKKKYVLKPLDELTREQTAAIYKYEPGEAYTLYNKDTSLDKLARYFKLYSEIDQTITNFVLMPEVQIGGQPMVFNIGEPAPKRDKKV